MRNRWGGKKLTRAEREAILSLYLDDPNAGSQLAMSHGLSQIYAYKLAHERGLLPITRWPTPEGA